MTCKMKVYAHIVMIATRGPMLMLEKGICVIGSELEY